MLPNKPLHLAAAGLGLPRDSSSHMRGSITRGRR